MTYQVTDEQAQIRSLAADVLTNHGDPRAAYDGGPVRDLTLWGRLCELGLIGVALPETLGGAGGSLMDETILAEQIGAATACVPIVTSGLAAAILAGVGSAGSSVDASLTGAASSVAASSVAASSVAASLTGGAKVVLAAVSAAHGFDMDFTASRDGETWRISGSVDDLIEGGAADLFVVSASHEGMPRWFVVDAHSTGIEFLDQPSLDPTQRLGAITATAANAVYLGDVTEGSLAGLIERAWVLLSAQAVGAAAKALDITVAYAKERHAFGQPIGRFQAIKHRLAQDLVDIENARSAVYNAAWAIDAGRPDASLAARMAKAVATENAVHVIHDAIQSHGGIGFTWEYGLHLFLRRAKTAQLVLGSPDEHFEALGRSLLEQRSARARKVS